MAPTPVLFCIDVTEVHFPAGRRCVAGALTALIFMSSGSAVAMGDAECRNLKAILTHGPDYNQLKGEAKSLGNGIYQFALKTSPVPFEQCEFFTFPFVDPTKLECRIGVSLEADGVMTRENQNYLKKVISGVAQDIGTCIGGTLPPVKALKPYYGQPAELELFEWAFAAAYHGPSPGRAVGVRLWMLVPKVGTDMRAATKVELEAHFHNLPKEEVGPWVKKSG